MDQKRMTVTEYSFMSPSAHYGLFQRQDFPVNHLHWYQNNQEMEHKHKILQQNQNVPTEQHKTRSKETYAKTEERQCLV